MHNGTVYEIPAPMLAKAVPAIPEAVRRAISADKEVALLVTDLETSCLLGLEDWWVGFVADDFL